MVKFKNKEKLEQLENALIDAQDLASEIVKLDSDEEINGEFDIYGQIQEIIFHLKRL